MHTLEVFYDYTCPFCLKGYELLKKIAPNYTEVEVVWKPCELSPQKPSVFGDSDNPRRGGSYSSLPIRGYYFAQDKGADLWAYNDLMYEIAQNSGADIMSIEGLGEAVFGLLDREAFIAALKSGAYMEELEAGNYYAYEKSGVWAVPAFRMDLRKLDSKPGLGVSKKQLEEFLDMEL